MTFLKQLIAPVLAAFFAVGASQAAVWQWSKTAATNASADASINWAEGMAPSAVNDSARAMMARIAEWRDDNSGVLGTSGTGAAYTITSNSGFNATPLNGQSITATFIATSEANATLAVDGGTAFPIQTGATPIGAGVIVAGTPYTLNFNSFEAKWKLQHFQSSPFVVPLGAVLDYTGASVPSSNFALANGQCISRTTYAAYFALVGTTYGACNGVTTFGVPDLSNRMVAGTTMGGTSRITVAGGNIDGTVLGGTGGLQNSTLTTAQMPSHTHTGSTSSDGAHTHTGTTGFESAFHTHSGGTTTESAFHQHAYDRATGNTQFVAAGGGTSVVGSLTQTSTNSGTETVNHTHNFTSGTQSAFHTHDYTTSSNGSHTHTFTSAATGGGGSHSILPPVMLLSKIVRIF